MTNQKWMDIPSKKRHFILGSFVDGMIYHPECVDDALNLLFTWNKKGLLKSIILPDEEIYFQDDTIVDPDEQEPDNMCNSCNGTGEGCNPDVICLSCSGSGVKKINNWDHESF
jgi:hypothetical protein